MIVHDRQLGHLGIQSLGSGCPQQIFGFHVTSPPLFTLYWIYFPISIAILAIYIAKTLFLWKAVTRQRPNRLGFILFG